MSVRLGPISATFLGNAEIARDPARYSGTIRGHGRDRTSGSGSTGEIRYALVDEGERTRVDIDVTASLTGTLAQFGRLGLVNDLVRRLTDAFSANLQARLRPGEPGGAAGEALAQPARLDLASMLLAVIGARLRLIANRLRGR
jgi:carbon-monoxide dehydrogenase small subunit